MRQNLKMTIGQATMIAMKLHINVVGVEIKNMKGYSYENNRID